MKGKPKKASGLGSGRSALNAPHRSLINPKTNCVKDRKDPTIKEKIVEDDDTDLNSGFGDYMRSPEAIEMMKLFVLTNSIVLILTMAWPSMKEIYKMFEEWWFYENL